MVPTHVKILCGVPSHEPPLPIPLLRSERRRGCPEGGRGGSIGSWSQLTSKFFEVFAFHDTNLSTSSPSGGRRHRKSRQDEGPLMASCHETIDHRVPPSHSSSSGMAS